MENPLKMIVGLGNPGPEYVNTRHNAGFMALDLMLAKTGKLIKQEHRYDSRLFHVRYAGSSLLLVQPLTFMNVSGRAVARIQRVFEFQPEEILVVYDCMDLPLGKVRLRQAGSSGGHNGMESIIQALGTKLIPRLRIGIGRERGGDSVQHVLSQWEKDEMELLAKVLDNASDAALCAVRRGVEKTMNQYNSELLIPPTQIDIEKGSGKTINETE